MTETFKPIPGWPDYQAGNQGNIRSLKGLEPRILKPGISIANYKIIALHKEGKQTTRTIHQLVAITYLNHKPDGYKLVVNHKNFNKHDNRLENLEIVTNRENSNQKQLPSSSKYVGVHWNKVKRKWKAAIRVNGIKKHLGCFIDELSASEAYQKALKQLQK